MFVEIVYIHLHKGRQRPSIYFLCFLSFYFFVMSGKGIFYLLFLFSVPMLLLFLSLESYNLATKYLRVSYYCGAQQD